MYYRYTDFGLYSRTYLYNNNLNHNSVYRQRYGYNNYNNAYKKYLLNTSYTNDENAIWRFYNTNSFIAKNDEELKSAENSWLKLLSKK